MSGSSRASRTISRCVVILDSGISISWATNPDGTYPGTKYHAEEEASYRALIAQHIPEIEALFDEMERAGRKFTSPGDPLFHETAQHAISHGLPLVEVLLLSRPELTDDELTRLAHKVAGILGTQSF